MHTCNGCVVFLCGVDLSVGFSVYYGSKVFMITVITSCQQICLYRHVNKLSEDTSTSSLRLNESQTYIH